MATADSTAPNGYGHQGYDSNNYASVNGGAYAQQAPQAQQPQQSAPAQEIPKDEIGWYFVEQYYTTLSKSPEKLHLFYNKRSHFVSGTEEDKVQVCVGKEAIGTRIKELDFQDAKVRVTNVDSQGSDANIVIQVIGEISNKGQPHKRFVQTFVLAEQTNGYFVLNDIFRYLAEEPEEEELQEAGVQEPAPTAAEEAEPLKQGEDEVAQKEEDLEKVDEKLETAQEESATEAAPAAAANGTPAQETAEAAPAEETPATPAAEETPAETEKPAEEQPAEKEIEEEKPKETAPAPAPAQKPAAAAPAAPPKPAAPRTWASLAASAHKVATPAVPAPAAQQASSQKSAPAAAKPEAAPAVKEAAPAREESPATSQGEAGWQSVSGHKKEASRAQNQAPPAGAEGKRAFINGVYSQVQEQDLKEALSKFGEIIYLDISRQKNCAFVDFKTAPQFEAAVAANPHRVNSVDLTVEERRQRPNKGPFNPNFRGGAPRGRGGMNQGPRGGFVPRGRGGAPARGGRPAPQEA